MENAGAIATAQRPINTEKSPKWTRSQNGTKPTTAGGHQGSFPRGQKTVTNRMEIQHLLRPTVTADNIYWDVPHFWHVLQSESEAGQQS